MDCYILLNMFLEKRGYSVREILLFFAILFSIFLISYLPVSAQPRLGKLIDDWKYTRIRFRPFSALFRTVSGEKVSKYGVIPALLVVQIAGYVLSFCCAVAFVVLLVVFGKRDGVTYATICAVATLIFELIIDTVIVAVLSVHSKKKPSKYATREEARGYFYLRDGYKYTVRSKAPISQKDTKRQRLVVPETQQLLAQKSVAQNPNTEKLPLQIARNHTIQAQPQTPTEQNLQTSAQDATAQITPVKGVADQPQTTQTDKPTEQPQTTQADKPTEQPQRTPTKGVAGQPRIVLMQPQTSAEQALTADNNTQDASFSPTQPQSKDKQ